MHKDDRLAFAMHVVGDGLTLEVKYERIRAGLGHYAVLFALLLTSTVTDDRRFRRWLFADVTNA